MSGRLILAGTPIGNSDDASLRLRDLLEHAPIIAAEDTRRLYALAQRLNIVVNGKVVSFHEHNENDKADELLDAVESGQDVLVVTDAGMPSVSDPGYRVVSRAIERNLTVTAAPGPSAVLTALALSGLPTDRFTFEGFPPRKPGELQRALAALRTERRTMVFFESTHRIAATLEAMAHELGAHRRAAVCRELTKTYEQVLRGTLEELSSHAATEQLRGEIAIVVAGDTGSAEISVDTLVAEVLERVQQGERLKTVVAEVAQSAQYSKRELYAAALAAKSGVEQR
ncbi:16S rRNA (cytidine(1402)-2'-O)-methyltransferase [Timonella sp. A28]|uniref:16S rRNA (cytidine(1402)-2'-O)-methyltransferase n=1 Tax=Timonella sp. A28 TaxID=3442640 RepID=UPI003EC10851